MTIKKIEIENIKGISKKTFELDIIPNRPSLLVAPNGFGKSSFATSFKRLNRNKISLKDDEFHKKDLKLKPKLTIEYEDESKDLHLLLADSVSNEISNHFSWFVISNEMKAKGAGRSFNGRTNISASILVDPIILIDTIPKKSNINYSYADCKRKFGKNGKILPNLKDYFSKSIFVSSLGENISDLEKFSQKKNQKKIDSIIEEINKRSGTKTEIIDWIEKEAISSLYDIEPLKSIFFSLESKIKLNKSEFFLLLIQIVFEYEKDKSGFKSSIKYNDFLLEKEECKDIFDAFNSSWQEIKPREKKGKLIVELPKVSDISNGQRDVITFIASLYKAKRKLIGSKEAILIIDEVFDYLDDANLVAVQYYITKLIEDFKRKNKRLYPLILTHLNPHYFKNFTFSKQRNYFLYKKSNSSFVVMDKLLRNRDNKIIKDDVSKFLLHYNPEKINRREDFKSLNLKEKWGEGDNFYKFIRGEAEKYLSNDESVEFDPLAVCCAVRVSVEEYAYKKIKTQEDKDEFIETYKTRDKLSLAEKSGVSIPEYFYLMGVIYNDGMHWKNNQDNISPISSKLENQVIRSLIGKILKLDE